MYHPTVSPTTNLIICTPTTSGTGFRANTSILVIKSVGRTATQALGRSSSTSAPASVSVVAVRRRKGRPPSPRRIPRNSGTHRSILHPTPKRRGSWDMNRPPRSTITRTDPRGCLRRTSGTGSPRAISTLSESVVQAMPSPSLEMASSSSAVAMGRRKGRPPCPRQTHSNSDIHRSTLSPIPKRRG